MELETSLQGLSNIYDGVKVACDKNKTDISEIKCALAATERNNNELRNENFQGDTNDDIFEVINISKRQDIISHSQGEHCSGEAHCDTSGFVLRESVACIERDLITLRGELVQDIDCAVNKTNDQAKQITSLKDEISDLKKQFTERNKHCTSLQQQKKQMESKINSLQNDLEKQSRDNKTVLKQTLAEFKKVYDQNKMIRSEFESQNKELNRVVSDLSEATEPLKNIPLLLNKLKTAQDALKTNVDLIKKRVDNGCLNIRRLEDEKSLGVSSKVILINSKVKDIEQSVESMTDLIKSVTTSTTDIRKRLSNVEKDVKCDTKKTTYSEATISITKSPPKSQTPMNYTWDQPTHNVQHSDCVQITTESPNRTISKDRNVSPDDNVETVIKPTQTESDILISHDNNSIENSPDPSVPKVTSAVNNGTTRRDHENTATEIGKNIGVWIPSDQCCATLPLQTEFSGVSKQRIARFYIAGINKSSTETGLRNFLSDKEMYKQAKDIFRSNLNKAYLSHKTETYATLDEACNLNHKSLWAKLRNKKKSSSIMSLNIADKTITHPEDICNAMADHFSNVFSDTTANHFDDNFKSKLAENVPKLDDETEDLLRKYDQQVSDVPNRELDSEIIEKEILNAVHKLKTNKSSGIDKEDQK
ncbi:uncharacterized protein LOC121373211 [Gigantopelta aegis]|uniref:uncharacterized protein LOC121373211 n=1 Tax=Gigantopelta aegis TaxID=1735272 RepID=UPI001B887B86|nr:uncharacterized protein LOC121373211 [Gigantopelta aegis]